jgi:ribokinase/sulfofructose kinase
MPETLQRPIDILAVGGVDVDLVMRVDRLPGHGEKVMGDFVGRLPGGTVANFACATAALGMRVASLSTIGGDDFGQRVLAGFDEFGVSTEHVLVYPAAETHFTVILIEPSGERSIVVVPMLKEKYDTDYLTRVIPQARALYTMPNDPALFQQMGQITRSHGVLTMIDVEATIRADSDTLRRILQWVDVASFNEGGLQAILGERPTIDGARRLLEYGPQTVVVTLGGEGALAVTKDEAAQVEGWKVDVVDTTGAGDTFNAGFLTATLRNLPLWQRLAFANAAAALAVTGLGPRGRLPSTSEVAALLAG